MACFSGPEIPNEGLVFYYDQGNTDKSWKGAPAVNLAASNFFNGNGANFTINDNVSHVMPDGSTGVARLLNAQFVSDGNRTVSIGSYALIAGQTYTLSFYVMNIDCTGFSGNLYSPTLSRVIGNITYPTVSTQSWTRVTTTFTVPNEGPNPVTLAPQAFRDGGNGRFKLCWLQLEQNTFARPYVNGTRSSTQALLDMTGQNIITANSLTYASDDSFSFNGTSDFIGCGNNAAINFGTGDFTVSAWFKRATNATTNLRLLSKGGDSDTASRAGFAFVGSDNSVNFTVNPSGARTTIAAAGYTVNEWVNVVGLVERGVTMRSYKNGTLVGSAAAPVGSVSGDLSFFIGNNVGSNLYWPGNIPQVSLYNRALTAEEVQQNFNALRGRYGI